MPVGGIYVARLSSKISIFQDVEINYCRISKLAEPIAVSDALTKGRVDRSLSVAIAAAGITAGRAIGVHINAASAMLLKLDGSSVLIG